MKITYVVTDIETNGPNPDLHSMLAFGCVAVSHEAVTLGEFEAVLEPRKDRGEDVDTMRWWDSQPDAWLAATRDPLPAGEVMPRFADWVDALPGVRIFAARPLMFDGQFVDTYLRTFGQTRAMDGPFRGRQVFSGAGLDLGSLLMGAFGHAQALSTNIHIPPDWLGYHEHTHRAIDDARGYAELLKRMLVLVRNRSTHPDDLFASHSP